MACLIFFLIHTFPLSLSGPIFQTSLIIVQLGYNIIRYIRRVWWYQWGNHEFVNRRRTDNTMVKRKKTNNDLQNTTQKTKMQVTW